MSTPIQIHSVFPYPTQYPTRKPDLTKPKATASWWTPLFGWSSEPDYITNTTTKTGTDDLPEPAGSGGTRSKFVPGGFTEEKARELRRKTRETAAFHDMYHSAIASRLASDVSDY